MRVFFRSGTWCPFCQAQLISLTDAAAPLQQRGYRLTAISYDAPEVLADFTQRRAISYAMLSDDRSAMIDAFKLRDPQYKPGSMAFGVPQPSIFVVSRADVIQAMLAEEGYKTRPPVDVVLKAADSVLGGRNQADIPVADDAHRRHLVAVESRFAGHCVCSMRRAVSATPWS